ncbi:hypothetical protein OROGR_014386 [Orobanche gracilis]
MSTTYFLTFLLGLLVLTTIAAGEQNGGGALDDPREMPSSTSRFRSRNLGKLKNHISKSIRKSVEGARDDVAMRGASLKHAGARRTMEKESEIRSDGDRAAAGFPSLAKNDLENNGRAMPENRPDSEYFVPGDNKKTTMEKLEKETKDDKPAGYRAKAADIGHKYGNMHNN